MTLSVCLPVLNQKESTQKALDSLKNTQDNDNRYIIVDNGSDDFVRNWLQGLTTDDIVIRNDKNVGLPKALNQALKVNTDDYLFCTHTDIEMFERGWDTKVLEAIKQHGNVGVAGFYGAKGIGTPDIYQTPYQMHQLVRIAPFAGLLCRQDPAIHHHRQFTDLYEECAVLDGFSLITHKDLRFETSFGPHHMYDNDLCLQAIDQGKKNIVINMDIIHYGGRTDVGEDWASPFGKTKQEVHQEAHPPFYEKWRHLLPYCL